MKKLLEFILFILLLTLLKSPGYSQSTDAELPVEFTYFQGTKTMQGILLTWGTATETNNDYFLIERSNGTENKFKPLTKVPGKGTTQEKQSYQVLDEKSILGTTYYRIKQVDFDGKFAYSKIISIKEEIEGLYIYPNPATAGIQISYTNVSLDKIQLLIYNSTGQLIQKKQYLNNAGNSVTFNLDNLQAGTYFVVLINGEDRQSKKFIKL